MAKSWRALLLLLACSFITTGSNMPESPGVTLLLSSLKLSGRTSNAGSTEAMPPIRQRKHAESFLNDMCDNTTKKDCLEKGKVVSKHKDKEGSPCSPNVDVGALSVNQSTPTVLDKLRLDADYDNSGEDTENDSFSPKTDEQGVEGTPGLGADSGRESEGQHRGRDMLRSPASLRSQAPKGSTSHGLSPRSPLPATWVTFGTSVEDEVEGFVLDESEISSSSRSS